MDRDRLQNTLSKLELLDDRLAHRVRSVSGRGRRSRGTEQLDEGLRTLAEYVLELKEVVRELMESIAAPRSTARDGATVSDDAIDPSRASERHGDSSAGE